MSSVAEIQTALTKEDYKKVTDLAGKNFGPSKIALSMGLDKRAFNYLWRDTNSLLRLSYERGRLKIEKTKAKGLTKMVKDGNVTAYQIMDKRAKEQAFEDIKQSVFG